jgi:hypothetical protein
VTPRPLLLVRLGLALLLAAVALGPRAPRSEPLPPPEPAPSPPSGPSNIHARDYVGPKACAECHEENYALWKTHPHSRMNLDASPDTVLGDFSGHTLEYGGGTARFERLEAGGFGMTLRRKGQVRRYRVTRVVGSRFTQMYVGVQTEGPEPPGDPVYRSEGKLAFGWWISREAWFPESYFDSDCPPEYDARGRVALPAEDAHGTSWETNCIFCHNTYPYEERLRERAGTEGFPAADLALNEHAGEDPRPGLSPGELTTLGISCESCHFGGREHALEDKPIRFLPTSPALDFERAKGIEHPRQDAYVINSICAQCHYSRGVSPYPNQAGTWNSREAVDLKGGACATRIKCTDCHDPHQPSAPGGGPDLPAHIATCLECHPTLADAQAREDHTQHPGSVSCLDCHMPRITQGLETVVRTHQITSPGDPRMLSAAAPNACNLCHLNRSIRWTLGALRVGWKQKLPPLAAWKKAYGSLDAPVGQVWLTSDSPSHRLVAADAYSRSPLGKHQLQRLIRTLDDSHAVNRMFGLFAVERVLGRRLTREEYAPVAPPARRRKQVRALLAKHR